MAAKYIPQYIKFVFTIVPNSNPENYQDLLTVLGMKEEQVGRVDGEELFEFRKAEIRKEFNLIEDHNSLKSCLNELSFTQVFG